MGITKDNPLHMLLEFQQMESGESIYHKEELMKEIFPPHYERERFGSNEADLELLRMGNKKE